MKRLVFILVIIFPCFVLNAKTNDIDWDYPIVPGTNEWKMLKNYKEKVEACQIPVDILHSLSTQRLLELCENYPLLVNIVLFNNVQNGFNSLKDFNGMRELLTKKDLSTILLNEYSKIDPTEYQMDWHPYKRGMFTLSIKVLELILAQDEVINNLDKNQKKDAVGILLMKKEKKLKGNKYGFNNIVSIYYAATKIILSDNISNNLYLTEHFDELLKFSETGDLKNPQLVTTLDNLIANYLKQ
jgi:hypothetical protein